MPDRIAIPRSDFSAITYLHKLGFDIAHAILALPLLRVGHHPLLLLNSRMDETFTRRRLSTKTPTGDTVPHERCKREAVPACSAARRPRLLHGRAPDRSSGGCLSALSAGEQTHVSSVGTWHAWSRIRCSGRDGGTVWSRLSPSSESLSGAR